MLDREYYIMADNCFCLEKLITTDMSKVQAFLDHYLVSFLLIQLGVTSQTII